MVAVRSSSEGRILLDQGVQARGVLRRIVSEIVVFLRVFGKVEELLFVGIRGEFPGTIVDTGEVPISHMKLGIDMVSDALSLSGDDGQ
jgi:hypothetical protein